MAPFKVSFLKVDLQFCREFAVCFCSFYFFFTKIPWALLNHSNFTADDKKSDAESAMATKLPFPKSIGLIVGNEFW